MVDATLVAQFVVNGVVFGAVLALGAIGLSLVYGILGLSNFAHGDMLTFGAFASLWFGVGLYAGHAALIPIGFGVAALLLLTALVDARVTKRLTRAERASAAVFGGIVGVATLVAMLAGGAGAGTTDTVLTLGALLAVAATVVLTVGLELAVWRPLRRKRATLLTLVIVSVGISLVLRNALQQVFGGGNKSFDRPQVPADAHFGILISPAQQLTIVAAIVLIAAVHAFLRYTKTGKSMRAVADNIDLARVSGIDVDRVVVYVWAIAGALVAVAGVLLTLIQNNNMNVNMGFNVIVPLFAAVILGGIGSAYGAMLGGLAVGVAMKTSALWLGTEYELTSAFFILTIMLFVRPQGLLGVKA